MGLNSIVPALGAFVAVNVLTLLAFRHDKQAAVAGRRRVREVDLLALASLGGTPAAFFARRRYRHKTRKQPFSTVLWLIAAVQAGLAIGVSWR